MAVASAQVTMASGSATAITTGADTDNVSGMSALIRNSDATITVYVGGATVSSATGFALIAGAAVSVDLQPGDTIYGRSASGAPVIHVLKTGV